jgi:hypothetical protein
VPLRRTRTDVLQEGREVRAPLVAHVNAAPPVPRVKRVLRVVAAGLRVLPRAPFRSGPAHRGAVRQGPCDSTLTRALGVKTPAARSGARAEVVAPHGLLRSAIATADPLPLSAYAITPASVADHREATVAVAQLDWHDADRTTRDVIHRPSSGRLVAA